MDVFHDDVRNRVRARVAEITSVFAGIDEELSGRRFSAAADDGLVVAEVDTLGHVTAVRFRANAMTRSRASRLGTAVVQAVTSAQAEAGDCADHLALSRLGLPVPRPRTVSDRRRVVTEAIEASLGQVGVDAAGTLVEVDLDERTMRTMRADRVGDYLAAAINRAAQRSRQPQEGRR